MIKRSLVLSSLLAGSIAFPAVASPVCYMQSSSGEMIDLTNMCGPNSSTVTVPVIEPSVQPVNTISQPERLPDTSDATFQVTRIGRDGKATGRVNFSRTAPEGTRVIPYVVFSNGTRWRLPSVTRERGQRRVEIQFNLPIGTTTSEVEGGII